MKSAIYREVVKMTRKEELEAEEAELYERITVTKHIQYLRENKEIILSLIDHSRTSCSDDNCCNGYIISDGFARCNKCFLIEILNGEWGDGDFEVTFDVNISPTEVI